jgi:DNA-binding transcriptional LysR family regulator
MEGRELDLVRHLRFFAAVAEERHFGQAAFTLGMTQPPLSQGVQRLEKYLGVQLFERGSRGVSLTPAGVWLLPLAQDVVRRAERFVEEASSWSSDPVLRIGLAADLEELAGQLTASAALVAQEIRPVIAGSVELVGALHARELDIAVVRHPGVLDGVTAGAVHTLSRRVYRGSGRAVRGDELRASDVPVVVPPRRWQPPAHDQLVDSLRRLGHTGAVLEHEDFLTRRTLVAAGTALGLELDAVAGRRPERPTDPDGTLEPGSGGISLRVRVAQPVPSERQSGLDHQAISTAIEAALTQIETPR